MTTLRLCAPAKVNLGLRVVGRRADGYHLLDTTFHALQLHDVLRLHPADTLCLDVRGDGGGLPMPAADDNLVLRAARAFARATSKTVTGRFELEKRIPAGGGLGGGSSDAAAALLLLQHRAGHPLAAETLASLALSLGADVPFFLRAGTQRAAGVGEVLSPCSPPAETHFVLLLPPFGTSTATVFKNYRAELTIAGPIASIPPDNPGPIKGLSGSHRQGSWWRNDLEAAAMELHPELARIRAGAETMARRPVLMSGSGSTLFLALTEAGEAARLARDLASLAPGLRVVHTTTADTAVGCRVPVCEATPR